MKLERHEENRRVNRLLALNLENHLDISLLELIQFTSKLNLPFFSLSRDEKRKHKMVDIYLCVNYVSLRKIALEAFPQKMFLLQLSSN